MKNFYKTYIGLLYASKRLYTALAILATSFLLRFFVTWLADIPFIFFAAFIVLIVMDYAMLFSTLNAFYASRNMAERLSNGDNNDIKIYIESRYKFEIQVSVIDEIPFQFQERNILFRATLKPAETKVIHYQLRPVKRGGYAFGDILIYASTIIGLFNRKYVVGQTKNIPVYPSYLQLRKYQLIASATKLQEAGIKKIRRVGHSMEFEQIKEYVSGDDYRTVNWKATARRGTLMVNNYTDEKSQQIYCVIDKGRVMKMPFNQLTLLDYAINASLVLSNVALTKGDRAGLITFAENISTFLPADKKAAQMLMILEALYKQKTRYLESDFERLFVSIKRKAGQRSLIILFTHFESLTGMRRHLTYLKKIAEYHLLLVVLFENTEITSLIKNDVSTIEQVYTKSIAENFLLEKRLIAKELKQAGIQTILTAPEHLTVNALNKYLEIKSRQLL